MHQPADANQCPGKRQPIPEEQERGAAPVGQNDQSLCPRFCVILYGKWADQGSSHNGDELLDGSSILHDVLILLTSSVDHLYEAIQATLDRIPNASISLLAQQDIAKGLEGIPHIQTIITAPRAGEVSFSFGSKFISTLRQRRFERCVILLKDRASRVGIRAIFLALCLRARRRTAHVKGEGFISLFRASLASMRPSYLIRRPLIILDALLALLIRRAADTIVSFIVWREGRRRTSRKQ